MADFTRRRLLVAAALAAPAAAVPEAFALERALPSALKAQTDAIRAWRAGTVVSPAAVEAAGPGAAFRAVPVSKTLLALITGKSYKPGLSPAASDLRYLKILHRDAKGRILLGELICHRLVADDLLAIFRELFEAHYPVERMVLVDNYGADDQRSMAANNTSAFNTRTVAGSKKLSAHGLGAAVDINPFYNPCVRKRKDGTVTVDPASAAKYADRTVKSPYRLTRSDPCTQAFLKRGWVWGGDWKSLKDWQHFEKKLR